MTGPRVRAVFEVGVDVLVTKDGEIEDAQAGAKEPGRRHHHQWYLECQVWSVVSIIGRGEEEWF